MLSRETLELIKSVLEGMSLPVGVENFLEKAEKLNKAMAEITAALEVAED